MNVEVSELRQESKKHLKGDGVLPDACYARCTWVFRATPVQGRDP